MNFKLRFFPRSDTTRYSYTNQGRINLYLIDITFAGRLNCFYHFLSSVGLFLGNISDLKWRDIYQT